MYHTSYMYVLQCLYLLIHIQRKTTFYVCITVSVFTFTYTEGNYPSNTVKTLITVLRLIRLIIRGKPCQKSNDKDTKAFIWTIQSRLSLKQQIKSITARTRLPHDPVHVFDLWYFFLEDLVLCRCFLAFCILFYVPL